MCFLYWLGMTAATPASASMPTEKNHLKLHALVQRQQPSPSFLPPTGYGCTLGGARGGSDEHAAPAAHGRGGAGGRGRGRSAVRCRAGGVRAGAVVEGPTSECARAAAAGGAVKPEVLVVDDEPAIADRLQVGATRDEGRTRYAHYRDRGYPLHHHEMSDWERN